MHGEVLAKHQLYRPHPTSSYAKAFAARIEQAARDALAALHGAPDVAGITQRSVLDSLVSFLKPGRSAAPAVPGSDLLTSAKHRMRKLYASIVDAAQFKLLRYCTQMHANIPSSVDCNYCCLLFLRRPPAVLQYGVQPSCC